MSHSRDQNKIHVLNLLREEKYTSKEIAKIVGVSEQVVMGFKSHWTLGKYGDVPRIRNGIENSSVTHIDAALKPTTVGNSPSWTYLLLSSKGEVYLGATTNLKKRLRSHNSPNNNGFTRGRRWHLLAARSFQTRKEAFDCENFFKKTGKKKWKVSCIPRATRIVLRFGYSFNPKDWDVL